MANKKINQLVLKTTIQPTDLFPLGDATTGQLFKKTVAELQAAIGGAVISVNGLVGTVVLDTDDIQELASPTNRYFTEARARAAISLTTTGSSGASTYSSSTGVLNVPTYTLAGLGGITASFLSGGTGITYNSSTGVISYSGTVYTDASVRGLVSAGTGLSYNSSTGVFSYSGTVYTDSSIRALISLTTTGSSGAATYNNITGVINVPNYTLAGLGGISLTSLSGSAPITYNSSTGAIGITQATTSTNGYLSATDWNTFNGKQSALTLGNVTESVSNVLMFPDGGTNKTIGNLSIQVVQAGSTSSGYLSTTDWNTFNNKQNAITLTTTGSSGAATFSGGTLNIPQYQSALTNPVTGTGTSGKLVKFTGTSTIGNSIVTESSTNISIAGNLTVSQSNTSGRIDNNPFLRLVNTGTSTLSQSVDIVMRWQDGTYNGTGGISMVRESATARSGSLILQPINSAGDNVSAMTLTSAGNVGIGGTPNDKLQVGVDENAYISIGNGGSTDVKSGLRFRVGGGGTVYSAMESAASSSGNGYLTFSTIGSSTLAERMRITSSGNVGIGTTYELGLGYLSLTIGGSKPGIFVIKDNAGNDKGYLYTNISTSFFTIESAGANPLLLSTNSGERMRITSGGNILMGTTTDNGERLYVSGSIRATGSITANSDARLKKNIERIENALEKVEQISGYTYNTIYDEDRHAGVIAQEIDKVLPEIVNKGNDGLMGVEYGNISALLIEAIKEQKVLIESLQAKVEALSK